MKSASSNLSISLAHSRYVSGVARSKLRESVFAITRNNLDSTICEDFKNRLTVKVTATRKEIESFPPIVRGDKKNAQKLIRLLNNLNAYIWALDSVSQN
jgi:hypothetical protein